MTRLLIALSLTISGMGITFAEDTKIPAAPILPAPKTDSSPSVLDSTWEDLQTADADSAAIKAAVSGLYKKAKSEAGKAAAREVFMKALKSGGRLVTAAEKPFREVFATVSWDDVKNEAMLERGLSLVAREQVEHQPDDARKTWEYMLKRLPECSSAAYVKSTWLPIALMGSKDTEAALKRLQELMAEAPELDKANMHIAIGDTHAVAGDMEKALAEFKKAVAIGEAVENPAKYDKRLRAMKYANLRLKTMGNVAPEIDSKAWLGAKAKKLSGLQGKVVVLDFWATW
ncbi:MAG: tetratricopeptide repeat protein [Planctomycetota bacterium]|jgi:tetratricopeptide (TPR) repeat protein